MKILRKNENFDKKMRILKKNENFDRKMRILENIWKIAVFANKKTSSFFC
jgi:hypothetical protein